MTAPNNAPLLPHLGILAGGGKLPRRMVDACLRQGRNVFVLSFDHAASASDYADVPYANVRTGAVGEAIVRLREAGVEQVVMAGNMRRPSLFSLKPDKAGAKLLARLGSAFFAGDDALLTALIRFLEEEGFSVAGVQDVLADLLTPAGVLGVHAPSQPQLEYIKAGITAARELGRRDKGQAVLVTDKGVTGHESAEGTNALIAGKGESGAILVKAKKPQQDPRADLPSAGVETVEHAASKGLAGIALEAGGTLLIDREEVICLADRHGLFIYGFRT